VFVLTGVLEREELDFDLLDFFSLELEAFLDSLVEKFLSGSARIESATKVGGSGLANPASSCKVNASIELFSEIPSKRGTASLAGTHRIAENANFRCSRGDLALVLLHHLTLPRHSLHKVFLPVPLPRSHVLPFSFPLI
jgi:hypothetical protein